MILTGANMDDFDRIPWRDLTHAYGSAEDVPDLLRALRTASPGLQGDESPLWQLFGNIWHQGTVYEATAYAVPFLIELASNRRTPDRAGILALLAEIAKGTSYREVHGNMLGEADFEQRKQVELQWVANAHEAVAKGFPAFLQITNESTDLCYAAAHVIAQCPERGTEAASVLRDMLEREARGKFRAGLLLLLGETGDRSVDTISTLTQALQKADTTERRAAALSVARLQLVERVDGAREAIIEVFLAEDIEESFDGLPWDAWHEIKDHEILASLDASIRHEIADELIRAIESGEAGHRRVSTLVTLLFPLPKRGPAPQLTAHDLSPLQSRAVRAMYQAMKTGNRIFYGHFPCWGLPDMMREWRELATGRPFSPVDESLPLLASPDRPRKPLRPDRLKVGDAVIHRHFGRGTITGVHPGKEFTGLSVLFDEEGSTELSLPTDGSPLS